MPAVLQRITTYVSTRSIWITTALKDTYGSLASCSSHGVRHAHGAQASAEWLLAFCRSHRRSVCPQW